jgi:hypothetical protein
LASEAAQSVSQGASRAHASPEKTPEPVSNGSGPVKRPSAPVGDQFSELSTDELVLAACTLVRAGSYGVAKAILSELERRTEAEEQDG